jgi:hypothetical protein
VRGGGLAVPELAAIEVHGMTRGAFLARATLAAGAVYGVGAVAPFVRQALAQEAVGDLAILNFALTLEQLEAKFYDEAKRSVSLGSEAGRLTEELATNEAEHVAALRSVIGDLGGRPVPEPVVDFGNAFDSQGSYLSLAQNFEDTGVAAYNGAGPMIESKEVLEAAGTIVQVEGRHAGLIRVSRDKPAAPLALDKTSNDREVRSALRPYLRE